MSLRNSSNGGGWGDASDSDDDMASYADNGQVEDDCNDQRNHVLREDGYADDKFGSPYESCNGNKNGDWMETKIDDRGTDDGPVHEEDADEEDDDETEEERQRRISEAKRIAQEKIDRRKKKHSSSLQEQLDDLDDILNEFGISANTLDNKEPERFESDLGGEEEIKVETIEGGTSKRKKNKKKKTNPSSNDESSTSTTTAPPVNGTNPTRSSETVESTTMTSEDRKDPSTNVDATSVLRAKQQAAKATSSSSKKSAAQIAAAKELKAAEELKKQKKKKKDKNNPQFGR